MINSNHVFLSGKGANDFAIKQGVKLEPDEYFFSQFRYDQWKEIRDSDNYSLDHTHQGLEELMKDKNSVLLVRRPAICTATWQHPQVPGVPTNKIWTDR